MTAPRPPALRQDIQQLRGVAVIAVIVNHLGVGWLPGGYLGVDMFFVVSGFVITLSMLSGRSAPSRARFFVQFWVRRMFRLWPMLFATVVATTVVLVATGLAGPEPLLTGLASVLALSNFRLLFGRLEYFALDTGADWFMHTWSLAVEEQIYVVLSVVFALVGVRRATAGPEARLRALTGVVAGLVVVSVVFAFLPVTSEVVRFYAPHTRFYQVGVGALVALSFGLAGRSIVRLPDAARRGVLLACAGGLLALFVADPWSGRFVSLAATALTVGLLAMAGERHHMAGFAPGAWLGRIGDRSYSLYLVHWPVQLFAATLVGPRLPRHALSLALTFVLGFAAYRLVEDRTRHRWRSMRARRSTAIAGAALLGTVVVVGLGYVRADSVARGAVMETPAERCTDQDSRIWLVGDSHLTFSPLEPVLARAFAGDCLNIGGYGVVMDLVWLDRESAGKREVRMRLAPTAWLIEQIRTSPSAPRGLVLVHFLSAFLADRSTAPASANFVATEWESTTGASVTREDFIALFAENLGQISAALAERGGEIVVTSPPPDFDWLATDIDPTLCSNRLLVSRECALYRTEARLSREAHEARGGAVRELLDGLQARLPNFTHVPLDGPFCGPEHCSNFDDGRPAYQDDDHLNVAGAFKVLPLFDDFIARTTRPATP